MTRAPDISMIINCHREGDLARHSLKFLQQLRALTEEAGLRIEGVVVIDKGDVKTKQVILNSTFLRDNDQLHEVSFGDLALSRNFGILASKAPYISTFDADDFYSRNWLSKAYHQIKKSNSHSVLHPEYVVSFGRASFWRKQYSQNTSHVSLYNLIKHNYWASAAFFKRQIIEKIPYQPSKAGSGFGYEDWHWNCELIAQGYTHEVVRRTILFYRLKEDASLCQTHFQNNAIIQPSLFFNQLDDLNEKTLAAV